MPETQEILAERAHAMSEADDEEPLEPDEVSLAIPLLFAALRRYYDAVLPGSVYDEDVQQVAEQYQHRVRNLAEVLTANLGVRFEYESLPVTYHNAPGKLIGCSSVELAPKKRFLMVFQIESCE